MCQKAVQNSEYNHSVVTALNSLGISGTFRIEVKSEVSTIKQLKANKQGMTAFI